MTDLEVLNSKPIVSCLCVTENRPEFIPWLLWNFDRQTWGQRELIIVDSSAEPAQIARDVRVIAVAPGTNIPGKRNIALKAAVGDIITWFDDDDWQHPCKLEWLVEALQDGAPYAGTTQGWFVDLMADRCRPYHSPKGRIVFNSAGFRREAVANILFPETAHKASDTRWMQQVERQYARQAVKIPRKAIFFWLCHTDNLSNPVTKRPGTQSLDTVRQIVAQSWGETDEQLATLRARLAQKQVTSVSSNSRLATKKPKVSACLLSWKRPQNLQRIVDSLEQHDFIGEILVWNNNPDIKLSLRGKSVRVIQSPVNEICYGRFLCAQKAQFDVIYTQDDDVLVQNVSALYQQFLSDDSCITHTLAPQHMRQKERYKYTEGHHALLGWGSFFRKEWLSELDDYVRRYGSDEVLRWGADKVFTILLNKTHNTHPAKLHPLPHGTTKGIAMYRAADHHRKNSLAVRQALAALRERKSVAYPVTWNVVIPCYNYGHFLAEAIDSVLDNDADYVITIVDDASTDETEKVGRKYSAKYPHITYLRLPINRGTSHARNQGVAAVDSLFVVLLDADDKIGRNYLYEAEKLLRSGCDVANPDAILFGQRQARWRVKSNVTLKMLLERNQVHCAAAFRRGYWVQVGGIAEHMTHWMDYHFWVRLAKAGARIRRLPGDHFYYRKHGHSKSAGVAQKREDLMRLIRVEGTLN